MAYRITYGGRDLFDPYTDDVVYDAKLTAKSNNPDYLDFTVPLGHDLYGEVEGRGEVVELSWDGTVLFRGEVESIDVDTEGNKEVACTGALSWLEDTVVRPYSTIVNEQSLCAPPNVDELFQWYVDQHDEHIMDDRRRFVVGVNQGAALDENNYVYRSSEQLPTTWDEISDKILDSLGGYVTVDYTEPTTINLYADVHETNAQVIDFGVNITDFSSKTDTARTYTAVRAVGKAPEKEEGDESEDEEPAPTLADLPDQCVEGTIWKRGDVVYDSAQVERYGYREYAYSNNDCTTAEGLLASAVTKLQALMSPTLTVIVKAADLALYMEGYDHLKVGQAARVRSALHDVDEYLMVSSVTVDLQDPGNTEYTLGAEYSTLTGQQSSYLKSQTASINKALDTATALSPEVKAAAKTATDAASAAATAAEKADAAAESVDAKLDKTEAADTYATIVDLKVTDGKADAAATDAADAKDTADTASAAATDAKTTADAAATDAATAKTDASAAKSTATAAKTTADAASAAATTAKTTASTAKDTADAAQSTATDAKDAADNAQTAADAAQAAADTAKAATNTLGTLIRETTGGVEVGKSADGSTYTGTHALVGTDTFSIHSKKHKELASFGANNVSLANATNVGTVGFFGGVDVIKGGIKYTSEGSYSSLELHAGKDPTEDEGWMYLASTLSSGVTTSTKGWSSTYPVLTATKKYLWGYSDSVTTPKILGVYTSGAESTGEVTITAHADASRYARIAMNALKGSQVTLQGAYGSESASLSVFPYSSTYGGIFFTTPRFYVNSTAGQPAVMFVGSKTVKMTAVDSTHSTCALFTAAQYKAITGVAFDKTKHNVTCMNGEHDACANIWSMMASYSESDDNIHLMCMTSTKVSDTIRVNYTITIDAS